MARISDMHKKWMEEPRYRKAYAALEEEFALASAAIDVRNRAGLTQEALARKMGTTQPVIARLESGRGRPSIRTLDRLAAATGSRLTISFTPLKAVSAQILIAQQLQSGIGRCLSRYANDQPVPGPGMQLRAA